MDKETPFLLVVFVLALGVGLILRPRVPEMLLLKEMEGDVTIGVLSDTHIPQRASKIPDQLKEEFKEKNVDLIIHAGDMSTLQVKEELEEIAPVVAVVGNMDSDAVRKNLPRGAIVKVNDFRVGVLHNTINPLSSKMESLASEESLDLVIFGHTHRNKLEKKNGVYYLNPGSPTCPILSSESFAIVKISPNEIRPKLIKMES